MTEPVTHFTGILGWSNKRVGIEFYHSWEDGRWGRRVGRYDFSDEPERGGWGHLLADDIEAAIGGEGRAVVVYVGERGQSAEGLQADIQREAAEQAEALRAALGKINDIRNSIVGSQTINWSEHIYPLVAALNEAGIEGLPYPEAQQNFGTLLERAAQAEARDVIPADAIQAIKTLPHITVDRMLGLWVELEAVVGLLEAWKQPALAAPPAADVAACWFCKGRFPMDAMIAGYEGLYEVTPDGRLWSVGHNWRGLGRREVSMAVDEHGYYRVRLSKDGVRRHRLLHQLVCEAFCGPRPSALHEVRHLNGNRRDNRAENLSWGTRLDNATDRDRHGHTARGERNRNQNRDKTECHRGHPFDERNTRHRPDGGRECLRCKADWQYRYNARQRATVA